MSLYDQLQCLSIVSVQHRIMCAFNNYYIFISSMFRNIQGHTFMICLNCVRDCWINVSIKKKNPELDQSFLIKKCNIWKLLVSIETFYIINIQYIILGPYNQWRKCIYLHCHFADTHTHTHTHKILHSYAHAIDASVKYFFIYILVVGRYRR